MDRLTITRLEVARTARVAVLGAEVAAPTQSWTVLHGYRQLADRFLQRFIALDDGTRRVVAPEALSRFYLDEDGGAHGPEHRVGASWMTRHDREAEIEDYVAYLDRVARECVPEPAPGGRIVLGFSQGVHTAVRWIVRGRARPPDVAVLWGAGLPHDLEPERAAARLAGTRVILVRGLADAHRSAEAERADADRLASWGAETRLRTHAGGHRVDADLLLELAASF